MLAFENKLIKVFLFYTLFPRDVKVQKETGLFFSCGVSQAFTSLVFSTPVCEEKCVNQPFKEHSKTYASQTDKQTMES